MRFLKLRNYRSIFATIVLSASITYVVSAQAKDNCAGSQSLRLVNGKIHTMDAKDTVVSSVLIKNGTFAAVGTNANSFGKCTTVINLRGRTVIPGITDNHNHIILLGERPGHDVRIDKANSIADALAMWAAKAAEIGPDKWVGTWGGWSPNQFIEGRFPTLAELDSVLPNNPFMLFESFAGPSQTNSAGKAFFESKGVPVGADGSIAAGFGPTSPSLNALFHLRALPEHNNLDAKKRGLIDALQFGLSVGVTTHIDQGSFHFVESYFGNPGTPDSGFFSVLASFDQYRAFDAARALHKEGNLPARIQINFLHLEEDPATPELLERLLNVFPNTGDNWLQVGGIGEFTAGPAFGFAGTPQWENGTRLVAQHGWRNENHSLTGSDFANILDGWGTIDQELRTTGIPQGPGLPNVVNPDGITKLRWVLAHVPFITPEYIDKAKQLGVGLSLLGCWRWLNGSEGSNGPPFRTILDSGARAGLSSDGMQISCMDPWTNIYYAVTGKNALGQLINDGQQITRKEAIRLYTADNSWFLGREDKLGTIETGKWADLVVLNKDFFNEQMVADDQIREIHSMLTIVNGRIVYDLLSDH